MARTIVKWRYGTAPDYSYVWLLSTDPPPAAEAVVVDRINEAAVSIKQDQGTNAHYSIRPIDFSVPASSTRYKDWIAPDFSQGIDILQINFHAADIESGDEIVAGKMMIGQVGQMAAAATTGATVVTVAAPTGVLRPTALGGVIDEGFYLSFGTDDVTDEGLNAGTQTELTEYEVKRIGNETEVGGGNSTVQITLLSGLLADISQGTAANLVVRFVHDSVQTTKGGVYRFGEETESGGNLPANRRIRMGFKNNSSTDAKEIRAELSVLY